MCFESVHTNPDDCVDLLVTEVSRNGLQLLVYEAFNLRAEKAMQQTGSELLTPQMIGAMRHICRRAGIPTKSFRPSDHKGLYKNAQFRPPNRASNEWASYGNGGHAKDSENLGEYFVRTVMLKGRSY